MSHKRQHPKPSLAKSFTKAQVAAGVATAIDYGVLFGLTEFLHVWYVIAVAAGAFVGAVSNFVLNRHWSFEATHGKAHRQAFKYTLVSAGSLILNTAGVWAVTEYGRIHYAISVVIVAIVVGVVYNFPLHRIYVFR